MHYTNRMLKPMNVQKIRQLFKAVFYCLLIGTTTYSPPLLAAESIAKTAASKQIKLTPRWTERYLFKFNPELVKNSHLDQVLSFYYFGSFQDFTIMGMERVKGEDYHQHNTLLIFKDSVLQGYYEELAVFPAGVSEQGIVEFPANNDVIENIDLAKGTYPAIVFARDKKINPESHAISERVSLVGSEMGEKIKDKR